MKKSILTTLILIAVLLLASCDYNDLGNMRRFNMGYAGDYAVAEAREATKNLVTAISGLGQMPTTSDLKTDEGKAIVATLRSNMAAVVKAVEDIKNSKDVESEMRALLASKVANTSPGQMNSNHFNFKDFANNIMGKPDGYETVFRLIIGASVVGEGDSTYATIEEKYGIYPNISLTVSPMSVMALAEVAGNAYSYKPDGALKTRMQELIDNLSSGEQSGSEETKKIAKGAAQTLSNKIIRPMESRYNAGYLVYADYIFTALFAEIVYTFHDLLYDMSVPMTEKVLKTDGVSRIVSYIGTIEYIYDVDFGIVDILNSMLADD